MTLPYKPSRSFTGSSENVDAEGTASIDYINADTDEQNKMFDPASTHANGDAGGIHKGNLATNSGILTEDTTEITANLTGNLTGDVTGDLTGDLKAGSTINTKALTDIFESNGTTVKNATLADAATNLAGGGAGQIPYQSGAGITAMLGAGTSGYILQSNGTSAPSWLNPLVAEVGISTKTRRITNLASGGASVPSSSSSSGTAGEVVADNNYLYVCVSANTWRRVAISTF